MSTPIRSVTELCTEVGAILTQELADVMTSLGFTDYEPVTTWQQVPDLDAIVTAQLPAGAIGTPTTIGAPSYSSASRTWRTTWRIPVGLYVRGTDHNDTKTQIQDRIAGIRTTLLRRKSLNGLAVSLAWVSEDYARIPGRQSARTIAAGAIAFDVTAEVTTDPLPAPPPTPIPPTNPSE